MGGGVHPSPNLEVDEGRAGVKMSLLEILLVSEGQWRARGDQAER